MSRRRKAHPPHRRMPRWLAVAGAILLFSGAGIWWARRPDTEALIDQAASIARSNPEEAERRLRQLVDAGGPGQNDARLALCTVQAQRHDWDKVRKSLVQVDLESCRPNLLLAFGKQALERDRIAIGRRALDTLVSRRVAESTEALEALTAHYEDWAESELAIAAARKLTELDPNRAKSWATLSQALGFAERPQEALEAAREGLRRQPSPELERSLKYQIAQLLISEKEFAAADRQLQELRKTEGDSPALIRTEVELYRRDGRSAQALELLNRVFPQIATQTTSYLQRGQIFLELKRYDEAARDFEYYLRDNPSNGAAEDKLSEAYRRMGKSELADEHHERAVHISAIREKILEAIKLRATHPTDPRPCRLLARLSRDLGEPAAAERWLERATALERGR
ncbi:MAG TPA: hypothetical protein VHB77_22500 [Planctomycetaceae bacterium]|nr:hypothetical protein [Planctomycetaceae bacterium]